MARPARTPRPVGRLLAGALALATLLLGFSAEGLHLVLEHHTWCAVHEAVEHGHDGLHEDEPAPEHSEEGPLLAHDDAEDDHERCRLTTLSREEDAALPDRALVRAGFAPAIRSDAPRAPADVPGVPRIRFAPKQSPPAA